MNPRTSLRNSFNNERILTAAAKIFVWYCNMVTIAWDLAVLSWCDTLPSIFFFDSSKSRLNQTPYVWMFFLLLKMWNYSFCPFPFSDLILSVLDTRRGPFSFWKCQRVKRKVKYTKKWFQKIINSKDFWLWQMQNVGWFLIKHNLIKWFSATLFANTLGEIFELHFSSGAAYFYKNNIT